MTSFCRYKNRGREIGGGRKEDDEVREEDDAGLVFKVNGFGKITKGSLSFHKFNKHPWRPILFTKPEPNSPKQAQFI